MGTALFEKRHYEAIAGILKSIEASEQVIIRFCIELMDTNKYFKPLKFLEEAGLSESVIHKFKIEELPLHQQNKN